MRNDRRRIRELCSIAKDLGYPKSVIYRVKNAKNIIVAENIMADARRKL